MSNDGTCFEGTYRYQKGSVQKIMSYAPKDEELHRIAKELQLLQRNHRYQLTATVTRSGYYYHPYSTTIEVDFGRYEFDLGVQESLEELLRDFMKWIYKQLEAEHDYRLSDECVDADIKANEYEFEKSGKRA